MTSTGNVGGSESVEHSSETLPISEERNHKASTHLKFFDLGLSSWVPKLNADLLRKPPRSYVARTWDYEDRNDFTSIFYDVFWSYKGDEVVIITPPLFNLEKMILGGTFYENTGSRQCQVRVVRNGPINLLFISASKDTKTLRFEFELGTYTFAPQVNMGSIFRECRVILTLSRNNPLHWIRDWVAFHVANHGTNAVAFYDNDSAHYSKYDIRLALQTVPGLKTVAIIDWLPLYGPPPSIFSEHDSRYLQRAMFEHARLRLLAHSASVLNLDVDEVVVSLDGSSVHDRCEHSSTGYLSFPGRWVERVTEDGIDPGLAKTDHRTFRFIRAGGGRTSAEKFCVAPKKLSSDAIWATHRVYRAAPDLEAGKVFEHRHIFGLKTSETDPRNTERLAASPFEPMDPVRHDLDDLLVEAINAALGPPGSEKLAPIPPFRSLVSGDVSRILAGKANKSGNLELALRLVEDSLILEPEAASYIEFKARCLERLGRTEEALDEQRRALKLRQQDLRFRFATIKKLVSTGLHAEAEAEISSVLGANPSNAEANYWQGVVKSAQRQHEAALLSFDTAVANGKLDCDVFGRLGIELSRAGKYRDAVVTYRRMKDVARGFDDWLRIYRGLIPALERLGLVEEVRIELRDAHARLASSERMTLSIRREFDAFARRVKNQGSTNTQTVKPQTGYDPS